jgi:hypothetical protein
MDGWMGGWMDGCKSRFKDCLQQSKNYESIKNLNNKKLRILNRVNIKTISTKNCTGLSKFMLNIIG